MRKANHAVATIAVALMLAVSFGPLVHNAAAQAQQPAQAAPNNAVQQPPEGGVNWPGAGYGVGALLCNVLYVPAKLTYAVVGGIVGGGTYLVTAGNKQAADTVWRSSLGGDYVVTPQMLSGDQPINFSGPTQTPPDNAAAAASPAMTAAGSSSGNGSVGAITPLPPAGNASAAAAKPGTGQPLDRGAGSIPKTSIE